MTRSGGDLGPLPDLVYPVKTAGEELRYSLRAIATNARGLYRKVWLVGDRPEWVTGVEHIEASASRSDRGEDVRAKIAAACAHPDLADRFVLLHDDYYLIDRIDRWDAYHMGPLDEWIERLRRRTDTSMSWLRYVTMTRDWVTEQGHTEQMAWQGHRPLMWDKRKLAETLAAYPEKRPLDVVGLYQIAGADQGEPRRGGNTKVTSDPASFHEKLAARDTPWLSSNDRSFSEGMIGGYIRGMFNRPCRYERGCHG